MSPEKITALEQYNPYRDTNTPVVYGFFGEHRFLSNFHVEPFHHKGHEYMSSEHAYMAAKTLDPFEQQAVRDCATPALAKRLGQQVTLQKDWDSIKRGIMHSILRDKFAEGTPLRERLNQTASAILIEANWWGDRYWGVCKGQGQSHLGNILMDIRDQTHLAL